MSKPPESPHHSDTDGVHQDGTGPGKRLDPKGKDAGDLAQAKQENVARPDASGERSDDDRTS